MALKDLVNDTTLKSLRYGNDQLNGGSSGQPYITTDVTDPNLTRLVLRGRVGDIVRAGLAGLPILSNITGLINNKMGKDGGFIRGGFVGAANASIVDLVRVSNWIVNNPLWIAKQVGLQLSNPRLEIPTNPSLLTNPGNLLSLGTNGILQPTRIYNLGINTALQIPANAFGIHFYRHGLGPTMDDNQKYEAIARANNDFLGSSSGNKLIKLKDKLGINNPTSPLASPLLEGILGFLSRIPVVGSLINSVLSNNTPIDDYLTGPGSAYGIGKTLIKRYQNTSPANSILEEFKLKGENARKNNTVAQDTSFKLIKYARIPVSNNLLEELNNLEQYETKPLSENGSTAVKYRNPTAKKYNELFAAIKKTTNIEQSIPFSDAIVYDPTPANNSPFAANRKSFKTIANIGLNRDASNARYYGKRKTSPDSSAATYDNTYVFDRYDSDILTVMFRGVDPFTLNEERWAFSAYLSGFKDDFSATWNDVNYIGRSETFYIYSKFRRSVSFSLKIPCFNRTQLFEKHRALGQLASTTAGRYNPNGTNALGGMLLRLNVGNYLVGEYATMNNLTYTIPDDSSWDITPEARLAMYIEANFSFNIVHQQLPQYLPSQQFPDAGMFGYLPDAVPGNKEFIRIPNRTTDEQNTITAGFSVNLVETSSQGKLYTSIKPVIDPVQLEERLRLNELKENSKYKPPGPSEVDPDSVDTSGLLEEEIQPNPEATFTTTQNNNFRGF